MVRRELLAQFAIFRDVEPEALTDLATLAQPRLCRRGELVVNEGEAGDSLFGICTGFLKASVVASSGTATTLSLMGAGETFGELSLLDGGPRSATVKAVTRAQLVVIERGSFLRLFESRPRVGIAMMEVVARRLRRLSEKSNDASALPVGSRLAKQILLLAETHGYRLQASRIRLAVPLSQKDLGELVSATRESVNKHLREWQAQKLITTEDGYLVITDLERLRSCAAARE
jgi:CRP/FNR family cyclic AMP-dependent transcriptional regulator